jgi:hypothetical protein
MALKQNSPKDYLARGLALGLPVTTPEGESHENQDEREGWQRKEIA